MIKETYHDGQYFFEADKRIDFLRNFTLTYLDFLYQYQMSCAKNHTYSLSLIEIYTLSMIEKEPGITVTELAEKWNKSTSTVSQTVSKLEQYQYVEKRKDIKEPKKNKLYITVVGEEVSRSHKLIDIEKANIIDKQFIEMTSLEKVTEFYAMLEIFTDIIKEEVT